jgi:hypothetical protein
VSTANAEPEKIQVRKTFLFQEQSLFRTQTNIAGIFYPSIKDSRAARQSNDETKIWRPSIENHKSRLSIKQNKTVARFVLKVP